MLKKERTTGRRKWQREPAQLPALYCSTDAGTPFLYCTIISISCGGAAVLMPACTFLKENAHCSLKLIVPKTLEQLSLEGRIRIKHRQHGSPAADKHFGIEFDEPLSKTTFYHLLNARPLHGWHSVLQKKFEYGRQDTLVCAEPVTESRTD